jgi:POT family proton-dependent oligopeptide transporter
MNVGGVPNDLIQNLDPLALVIFIPICDQLIYPWLRKKEIRFSALKRIFWGFMTGAVAMIIACIIQYYIYKKAPPQCGKANMNDCGAITKKMIKAINNNDLLDKVEKAKRIAAIPKSYADINVWVQTPAYIIIAFSEIFASITGLEYGKFKNSFRAGAS